jgi:hypothetical protein
MRWWTFVFWGHGIGQLFLHFIAPPWTLSRLPVVRVFLGTRQPPWCEVIGGAYCCNRVSRRHWRNTVATVWTEVSVRAHCMNSVYWAHCCKTCLQLCVPWCLLENICNSVSQCHYWKIWQWESRFLVQFFVTMTSNHIATKTLDSIAIFHTIITFILVFPLTLTPAKAWRTRSFAFVMINRSHKYSSPASLSIDLHFVRFWFPLATRRIIFKTGLSLFLPPHFHVRCS